MLTRGRNRAILSAIILIGALVLVPSRLNAPCCKLLEMMANFNIAQRNYVMHNDECKFAMKPFKNHNSLETRT